MEIQELEKEYSVQIRIVPEEYEEGTNWNWQILWEDKDGNEDGTYWYGDNGEHPTRESAEKAIWEYLELLDKEEHYQCTRDPYNRKGCKAHQQYCINIYGTENPQTEE